MNPTQQFIERALIYRSRDFDRAAFDRLVEMHHPALMYYMRSLMGRHDGADDATQEVWLAAYGKLWQLKDVALFRPWLYRIARNKAFDVLRVKSMRSIDAELPAGADGVAADEEPEPQFSPEQAAQVHQALTKLSIEHREVLTLRFLKDMSHAEIAAVTGADPGTVKSRIFYAKQSLRREMERLP
jgi:RNA polymerase sigma-70 factor, ECF subfamily